MNVHFAVITDLHVDIMHDGVARMQAFCEAAVAEHVDFLLHLGDMQYPEADFLRQYAPESLEKRKGRAWFVCDRDDEKLAVKRLAAQTGLKLYGVLGNHDMDSCDKATACRYWGMPGPRYSFVEGGVRFIALDTNFVREGAKMLDFDHCNYRGRRAEDIGFLTRPQLDWLEQEILRSQEPCVLLSHAAPGRRPPLRARSRGAVGYARTGQQRPAARDLGAQWAQPRRWHERAPGRAFHQRQQRLEHLDRPPIRHRPL